MITINERFENLLPPLSAEEFATLDKSLCTDGIREPIVHWAGTIVDGHNRYKIATARNLPFETVEKDFEDEDAACIWIIENQTGKRNLTDAQRTFQIGELYKLKKKKHGAEKGGRGNQHTEVVSHQNEDLPTKSKPTKTADVIAKEQKVSRATVERAAEFHTAVTDIAKATGKSTNDIIALADKHSKTDVMKIAKMEPKQQKEAVKELVAGKVKTVKGFELKVVNEKHAEQSRVSTKHNPPILHIGDGLDWIAKQEPCNLLLTDPPYMTDVDDIAAFAQDWLPIALSKVKTTGFAFVFFGAYPDEWEAYSNVKTPPNVERCQLLVWTYKNTLGNNPKDLYKQNYQHILFYRGVNAPHLNCPLTSEQWAVMEINAPDGRQGDRFHSWQKPMELAERLIRHTTKEGDTVYDPFACTGTFLLAANKLGRNGFGAEINAENAKIAIERGCVNGIQTLIVP